MSGLCVSRRFCPRPFPGQLPRNQRCIPSPRAFTGALCFLKHATTVVRALGTPSSRATRSSNTTAAHVAASTTTLCNSARSRPACRTGGRPPQHFTAPTCAREGAAVPNDCSCHVTHGKRLSTNRVAITGGAWYCVATARSTKRDRTAASSQRASAMRPTKCGLHSDLGFAWWLRLRVCPGATFKTAPLTSSRGARAAQTSLSDVIH